MESAVIATIHTKIRSAASLDSRAEVCHQEPGRGQQIVR